MITVFLWQYNTIYYLAKHIRLLILHLIILNALQGNVLLVPAIVILRRTKKLTLTESYKYGHGTVGFDVAVDRN
jgi:hypothetical protein